MLVESERDSLDGEMIVDSVGYDSVMKYNSAPTQSHVISSETHPIRWRDKCRLVDSADYNRKIQC